MSGKRPTPLPKDKCGQSRRRQHKRARLSWHTLTDWDAVVNRQTSSADKGERAGSALDKSAPHSC